MPCGLARQSTPGRRAPVSIRASDPVSACHPWGRWAWVVPMSARGRLYLAARCKLQSFAVSRSSLRAWMALGAGKQIIGFCQLLLDTRYRLCFTRRLASDARQHFSFSTSEAPNHQPSTIAPFHHGRFSRDGSAPRRLWRRPAAMEQTSRTPDGPGKELSRTQRTIGTARL